MKEKKKIKLCGPREFRHHKKTNLVPKVLTLGDNNFLNIFHHLRELICLRFNIFKSNFIIVEP
jgi:hypothetical protein